MLVVAVDFLGRMAVVSSRPFEGVFVVTANDEGLGKTSAVGRRRRRCKIFRPTCSQRPSALKAEDWRSSHSGDGMVLPTAARLSCSDDSTISVDQLKSGLVIPSTATARMTSGPDDEAMATPAQFLFDLGVTQRILPDKISQSHKEK